MLEVLEMSDHGQRNGLGEDARHTGGFRIGGHRRRVAGAEKETRKAALMSKAQDSISEFQQQDGVYIM